MLRTLTLASTVLVVLSQATPAESQVRSRRPATPMVRTYTAAWEDVVQEAHSKGYCTSIEDHVVQIDRKVLTTVAMAHGGPTPSVLIHELEYNLGSGVSAIEGGWFARGEAGRIDAGVRLTHAGTRTQTYRLMGPPVRCSGSWSMIAPFQAFCDGGGVVESGQRRLADGWTVENTALDLPAGFTVERVPGAGDADPSLRLSLDIGSRSRATGTIVGSVEFRGPRGARWQDAFTNYGPCSF